MPDEPSAAVMAAAEIADWVRVQVADKLNDILLKKYGANICHVTAFDIDAASEDAMKNIRKTLDWHFGTNERALKIAAEQAVADRGGHPRYWLEFWRKEAEG